MKDLIEKYNFNFKKKFGQNFLKDKNILYNFAAIIVNRHIHII